MSSRCQATKYSNRVVI